MKWAIKAMCTFGLLFLSLIVVSANATAQTFRGTILGTVIDQSGAAIPGAQVVAKNLPNHPNFCNPLLPNYFVAADNNSINPLTGQGQGFLPITATADVGVGNPFLGGRGPRGIQLALKFTF
jgi:hypothetical protein